MIKVDHQNGFSGVLYGESSMSIYDKDGHEVIHTGSRNINTEKELRDLLERLPELYGIEQ